MGQKIHPTGFRLAVTRNWNSRWYANNNDFAGIQKLPDLRRIDFADAGLAERIVGFDSDLVAEK